MNESDVVVIKSFKHNGHLHRMWLENRRVPDELLHPSHAREQMVVTVNCRTKIVEAAGSEWFSRSPGVTFFIPGVWYNIVALIENGGVRYYCNVASPPYMYDNVITYIDYDLDLIVTPSGERIVVDQDEYERHRQSYHYSHIVERKVREGLRQLTERADSRLAPFDSEQVLVYYDWWKKRWGDEA